jgi:hypothetical protein
MLTRAVNPSPPTDGLRFHELDMRWSTSRSAVGCGCNLARRAVSSSLLEHRPAGLAQAGLLPPQAGDNCPHIWDLACAKTIDVGGAGLFLFRRCLRSQRGSGCQQCKRQSKMGAARDTPRSGKPCLHDGPLMIPAPVWRRLHQGEYVKNFLPTVIFHTFGRRRAGIRFTRNKDGGNQVRCD